MLCITHTSVGYAQSVPMGLPEISFPLGDESLPEQHSVTELHPGLIRLHVERGRRLTGHPWVLSSQAVLTAAQAQQVINCFDKAGLEPKVESFHGPGDGHHYRIYSGGAYPTAAAAKAISKYLPDACRLRVTHRMADASWKAGPWSFDLLVLDPQVYKGQLTATSGLGPTPVSQLARQGNADIAINGGFFVMLEDEGLPGATAGISVLKGQWRHEPVQGRPFLLIRNGNPVQGRIVSVPPAMPLIHLSDGSTLPVTGINRPAGIVRNCGSQGTIPHTLPQHDVTCHPSDEVVAISPDMIGRFPASLAATAVIRGDGSLSTDTMVTHPDDVALIATGKWRETVLNHVARGTHARVDLRFSSDENLYAVNGGPWLVRDGVAVDTGDQEGWAIDHTTSQERATSLHDWYNRRNPRTAVGIGNHGILYFLILDGREFDRPDGADRLGSAGATIAELRQIMLSLGVRDAMGLDGGGSTTLVVEGRMENHPSDVDGERPVGDAILFKDP